MVEELKTQALLDPLLELGNRRYLEANIRGRLEELGRYGWQFGFLFADIDHCKEINDRNGHEKGDKVLRMVSKLMSNSLRTFDMVGRWDGEEFVVIVVNVQEEQLYAVANRLRMLVEQSSVIIGSETIRTTVSIEAAIALPGDDVDTLIKRADNLMYESKNSGRNCITVGA
jgi:diguanylate cyclase (GGDEF)-like protein